MKKLSGNREKLLKRQWKNGRERHGGIAGTTGTAHTAEEVLTALTAEHRGTQRKNRVDDRGKKPIIILFRYSQVLIQKLLGEPESEAHLTTKQASND